MCATRLCFLILLTLAGNLLAPAANNGRTIDDGVRTPCARADQCFGSSTRVSNVIQNKLMEAV